MFAYLSALIISILLYTLISSFKLCSTSDHKIRLLNDRLIINKTFVAIVLAFIPLIIVSGIRYSVGTDYWNTYYSGFYRVLNKNNFDSYEIGYLALIKIIQFFSSNVFLLFIITSAIFLIFTMIFIYEQSVNIVFSIALLFLLRYYFISMNVIREMIGISIMAFNIKNVINRKPLEFFSYSLIACSFHKSLVLMIPIYFLNNYKITLKKFFSILILTIFSSKIIYIIVARLLSNTKYGSHLINYQASGIKVTIFTILLNLFIVSIAYSISKKIEKKNKLKYNLFLNIQLIATLLSFLFPIIPQIERIYWMYSFISIVSIPFFFKYISNRKLLLVLAIALILSLIVGYLLIDIMYLNDHGVLPYKTIIGQRPYEFSGWIY